MTVSRRARGGDDLGPFEGIGDRGRNGHELQSIRADVRDVEAEDLCGFDAVIHLAAVCNDPVGDRSPDSTRVTVSIRCGWWPPIRKAR